MDRDDITAERAAQIGADLNAPWTAPTPLPWIEVARGAPYFVTDAGDPWTPIGQNDSLSWVELKGLFGRRDLQRHWAAIAHKRSQFFHLDRYGFRLPIKFDQQMGIAIRHARRARIVPGRFQGKRIRQLHRRRQKTRRENLLHRRSRVAHIRERG